MKSIRHKKTTLLNCFDRQGQQAEKGEQFLQVRGTLQIRISQDPGVFLMKRPGKVMFYVKHCGYCGQKFVTHEPLGGFNKVKGDLNVH